MKITRETTSSAPLLRPALLRLFPHPLIFLLLIFLVHAFIRFGGLWNPMLYPLSMLIIWPLPWLISAKGGRRAIGLKQPSSIWWWLKGPAAALLVLAVSAGIAWLVFGDDPNNWLNSHARYLGESLSNAPAEVSPLLLFAMATVPAMLFSPFAEEFLYRGYLLQVFSRRWGYRSGQLLQAAFFALVHLAHYGLFPIQTLLIALWVPSMFLAGLCFGWIARQSGSLWTAVIAHSIFNLGMNAIVFWGFPKFFGI